MLRKHHQADSDVIRPGNVTELEPILAATIRNFEFTSSRRRLECSEL